MIIGMHNMNAALPTGPEGPREAHPQPSVHSLQQWGCITDNLVAKQTTSDKHVNLL